MRARHDLRRCISGGAQTAAVHRIVRDSDRDSPPLLTVQEVAGLLRVPLSWVYEHVRPDCGDPLPHIKLGKYLRFRASDIDAYLESIAMNGRRS